MVFCASFKPSAIIFVWFWISTFAWFIAFNKASWRLLLPVLPVSSTKVSRETIFSFNLVSNSSNKGIKISFKVSCLLFVATSPLIDWTLSKIKACACWISSFVMFELSILADKMLCSKLFIWFSIELSEIFLINSLISSTCSFNSKMSSFLFSFEGRLIRLILSEISLMELIKPSSKDSILFWI